MPPPKERAPLGPVLNAKCQANGRGNVPSAEGRGNLYTLDDPIRGGLKGPWATGGNSQRTSHD